MSVRGIVLGALTALAVSACSATAATGAPSLGPLSSDPSSTQLRTVTVQVVPAGGSVDVPLEFEQSPTAVIMLYADNTAISASFGERPLTLSTATPWMLTASISNPADGKLHIANSGSTDVQVGVSLMIETSRTLTITAPSHDVEHGASVDFEVLLTQASEGDAATALLRNPTGAKTEIPLIRVGAGHWTGRIATSEGGRYVIFAATSGADPRLTTYELLVASGTVTLGAGFSERLVDSDNDGLADKLVLSPTVTVQTPGRYSVVAYLLDGSGARIDVTGGEVELVAGSQPLDFAFQGTTIYASGKSGPYRLAKVAILGGDITEARSADMGSTKAHGYGEFEH